MARNDKNLLPLSIAFIILIMFNHPCKGIIDKKNCNNSLSLTQPNKGHCMDGTSPRLFCSPKTLSNPELNGFHKPSRRFSIPASAPENCPIGSTTCKNEFEKGSGSFLDDYLIVFMELATDVNMNQWAGCGKMITTTSVTTIDEVTKTSAAESTNATTTITKRPTTPEPPIVESFQILFKNINLSITAEFTRRCPANTTLLILTMSRRDGFELRNAMRRNWLNDSLPGQSHRFLIADEGGGEAPEVKNQLEAEQTEHGDLIHLHGFIDRYEHLHLKMYGGFLWQQHCCPDAEWLLKADDDTVVHLARLDHWIRLKFRRIAKQHGELIYFGQVNEKNRPVRNKGSKVYVPERLYPRDVYPPYMTGPVYFTTTKTIGAILPRAVDIVAFHIEDVIFTGLLVELVNATRCKQKQHFLWNDQIGEATCENGWPTALSMWWEWGGADRADWHYDRLNSLKSKCE